jgi:tetratricopeptide (TPR) repeat protein
MNRRRYSCLLAWLAVFAFANSAAFAFENRMFDLGRGQYEAGDYAAAAKSFQADADAEVSPGLLHNLGNAEFKLGRLGPAILAWERARALDPGSRNTKANLRYARGHAGLETPEFSWYETYSDFFPADRWIAIAVCAFWGSAALLILPTLLHRRRTAISQAAAVLAIITFLLTLPALAGIFSRGRIGIVQAANTSLRLTPTREGEVLGSLPEGEAARVEKTRGEYRYVRASGDRAGWVRQEEFAMLWPGRR